MRREQVAALAWALLFAAVITSPAWLLATAYLAGHWSA